MKQLPHTKWTAVVKPPSDIPANAELIERALELSDALGRARPRADSQAKLIERMRKILRRIAAELRGEENPQYTLYRPVTLGSYLRSDFHPGLPQPEGNQVFGFVRILAYRAEALDLPEYVPPDEP
jgi:hypothetical protein